jgi:CO/xanthine dehydrogenase FAD-binding subunit
MSRLYNLREYHRPADIDEAVRLLRRKDVRTVALAGGTSLVGEGTPEIEAVVDLEDLKLDFIEYEHGALHLGAMLKLQTIVEKLHDVSDVLLADAAHRTACWNIRNVATVGGILCGGDIHSPFSVALVALKAKVKIYEQAGEMPSWINLASDIRVNGLKGRLITAISLTLPDGEMRASYEQVARTPSDRPIVSAAGVAYRTPSGKVDLTIAIGGLCWDLIWATSQADDSDLLAGVDSLLNQINKTRGSDSYQSDYRGSVDYRKEIAKVLARRVLTTTVNRLSTV